MSKKYVYLFKEGSKDMRALLGGKGANLAEMTRIGLPVPQGMTITTEACNDFFDQGNQLPEGLLDEVWKNLTTVEEQTGKKFGDAKNPLLVSVRSGAAISMPGMMDTVLNLGLNDETVKGFAALTNDERFALDCYRRFIQMYANVVMGIDGYKFDQIIERIKSDQGVEVDYELNPDHLRQLIEQYKALVKKEAGQDFPQEPSEQLVLAISAVFESWGNPRAIVYRQINRIPDDIGTAVNIQSMVYGNMGNTSGTGVAFTRNPATGARELYGEYLINAQGEDVVAGIRTPHHISELEKELPEAFKQFTDTCSLLENHYKDMQDIEFTIENGSLFILQTRNAKRTTQAAVRSAVEMVKEGLITRDEAVARIDAYQLDQLLHPSIDPKADLDVMTKGLPASPGAAAGSIVFTADEAEAKGKAGEKVILVRNETTPDDIHGMVMSQGVLTSRGGMTSHAAVVARGMGTPCVCGCEGIKVDLDKKVIQVGDLTLAEGDIITIDGSTGNVIKGEVPVIPPVISDYFQQILDWCAEIADEGGMNVHANADTPADARKALEFGARGIGLCRTEHMFMQVDRLPYVQEMILAENADQRRAPLEHLLKFQQEDFVGILDAMAGHPTTIRLLDPPLHEFLPNMENLMLEINDMKHTGADAKVIAEKEDLLRKVRGLHEANPMLGHRGCRLGITYPDVYRMQARAILNATAELIKQGKDIHVEIEIPLVIDPKEVAILRAEIDDVAKEVSAEMGMEIPYKVGAMLELPRACLGCDALTEHCDFFTFGTNDLTQTTLGFSRDDAEGKFLPIYIEQKILKENPFAVLDKHVAELVALAVQKGRSVKPDISFGICGEHGGDPASVAKCHEAGLTFVSCSPYRVPIAIVAAAQAQIKSPRQ
ncbi:pyruvate, phosphate dikinase [Peptococcus simiae]|uniref:Pyruvate, phosphate dikinase n=1 Tax=Peptococcus simiae TaxID=1643805 RepID=A0ABW9GXD8_9FIRM